MAAVKQLPPIRRLTDDSDKKIEKECKKGLDVVIDYPSWGHLFCSILLWSYVWNPDGVQRLQYFQRNLGKSLGRIETF
jgi:hypothetical protein